MREDWTKVIKSGNEKMLFFNTLGWSMGYFAGEKQYQWR
jgi:hypothetical protein